MSAAATATSVTVPTLTNGTSYTFTVAASNGSGKGAASTASAAVTPEDTIFNFAAPTVLDSGDPNSVELGVKFTSSVSRLRDRHPLLQGNHEHRHPRRQPVVLDRHAALLGDLHQ